MRRAIGRDLELWEDVHHKDEDPTNNDNDNLKILECGNHTQLHLWGSDGNVGVTWHRARKRWRGRVNIDKKEHNLGWFVNKADAVKAVEDFRRKTGAIGLAIKREPHYETERNARR